MCWLADQDWILAVLDDYARARQGFLPEAGGVEDQDAIFVQVWQELDRAMALVGAREQRLQEEKTMRLLEEIRRKG